MSEKGYAYKAIDNYKRSLEGVILHGDTRRLYPERTHLNLKLSDVLER